MCSEILTMATPHIFERSQCLSGRGAGCETHCVVNLHVEYLEVTICA
jgi:hypothetical protein